MNMQVETIHIDKVANGYLVIFHQAEGNGIPKGAKFLGAFNIGEPNEIEEIKRKALEKERGSRKDRNKAEDIIMKTGEDQYVFLTHEVDKMLDFLKYILTAEPEPVNA